MSIPVLVGLAVCLLNAGISLADCPYKFQPHGNSCYLFVNKVLVTWFEAKSFCSVAGGDLATIESKEEEMYIESQLRALHPSASPTTPENYWLDGTDILAEGEWRWMGKDGNSRMIQGYTAWSPGQPDNAQNAEHCLEIRYTFNVQWNDFTCEAKQNFICKSGNDWEAGGTIIG